MTRKKRPDIAAALQQAGGLREGASRQVAKDSGVPEAHVYGVGSFFHLLAEPDVELRVCTGLTCQLAGADALLVAARAQGIEAVGCSCLAACDAPVPLLRGREVLPAMTLDDVRGVALEALRSPAGEHWQRAVGPELELDASASRLLHAPSYEGASFAKARALGPQGVIDLIARSGLQGRGGAGFPAGIKWRSVAAQAEMQRYVVLNADEGEPGTFKDREVMLRRPDAVLEGLAIAALTVGAKEVYLYLRGEFDRPWRAMSDAIAEFERRGTFGEIAFHMHAGHGAYICGEETALIEALEGKRGMPRIKPPYPTEKGLWGKPTLVHNVETIGCVPAILERGAEWFEALGRTGAGTKLYCVSGHVVRPGTYELPLGATLDELVEAAGGYTVGLKAFSPGGASSGFLPAAERGRPLDFKALAEVGSMLGSAGVVVLGEGVDMAWAARQQLLFFEEESCGQCAPCRIGTRFVRERLDAYIAARDGGDAAAMASALSQVADVAWEMDEGSICGLGMTAPLPLTSAMRHFPSDFPGSSTGDFPGSAKLG
ncbi:MAG: SLBB domain-containing protein [Myxococcales bacterium]|nr:SLBB domain-containing protein [Myxococcales bacterium]